LLLQETECLGLQRGWLGGLRDVDDRFALAELAKVAALRAQFTAQRAETLNLITTVGLTRRLLCGDFGWRPR